MIKCVANPKKGGVTVQIKGAAPIIAVEFLSIVRSVVTDIKPEPCRRMIAEGIRALLDDLEKNASDDGERDGDGEAENQGK